MYSDGATTLDADGVWTVITCGTAGATVGACEAGCTHTPVAAGVCTDTDTAVAICAYVPAYFLLFGRFFVTFSPKTGAFWVNLAEKIAH